MKNLVPRTAILIITAILLSGTSVMAEPCVLGGDINYDSQIDAMDIIYFVDWLWGQGPEPPCLAHADVNCDCEVSVMDLLTLVDHIWVPVYPSPWCDPCALECWADDDCCELRGDYNHDGVVDEQDVEDWAKYNQGYGFPPYCWEELDCDGDGSITALDYVYLVNYVEKGGPEPVPCP